MTIYITNMANENWKIPQVIKTIRKTKQPSQIDLVNSPLTLCAKKLQQST